MTELKQARKTALSVAAVLLAGAAWSLWRGHLVRAAVFGTAGSLLLLMATVEPRWTARFHLAWTKLAAFLGYVNSRIILSVLYYGVLTPVGLFLRALGRDPLNRRHHAADSYWIPRANPRQDRAQFERLF